MEVKIGVQYASRELVVETDETADAVEKVAAEALKGDGVFTLTDTKGRKTIVPGSKITYIEIGGGVAGHVGFRS
ncbi:DUF3107 domain-containing protein [Nocardioides sp.]|uniref:DUF3107 domain-containing protein n=1 Tax=Nocardioides sp. TaxID=35761 RepID=UPI00286B69A1|nr:DUF3107 domain-containing protein [Nocardioides sp.]